MTTDNTFFSYGILLAIVTALSACGGGGGGSSGPVSAVVPPVDLPGSAPAPVTSVPETTYTGEQAVAFNLINAQRAQCGFGLLAQNAALDAAAASHGAYVATSLVDGEDWHTEVPNHPGFTGVTAADRALAKGYRGQGGDLGATGNGAQVVRGLLSAPYHLRALMDSAWRDVGIFVSPNPQKYSVINVFWKKNGIGQSANRAQSANGESVLTYPCNGSTGVNYELRGEIPNPIPGRDLSTKPIGTPIYIQVRADGIVNGVSSLGIASASMINKATGASVFLRPAATAYNDPHLQHYQGYIAPDAPLEKNTEYQVTITGLDRFVPFSRTFSFTTGSDPG